MRPEIKGFSEDNLKEVISIVVCHIRKDEICAPLKMEYIKKLVPQGDRYLMQLIKINVIQRSGIAIIDQCSFQYNFVPEYQSKYLSFFLNSAKLILRIEKARTELRKETAKSLRGHSEQVKYLKRYLLRPATISL